MKALPPLLSLSTSCPAKYLRPVNQQDTALAGRLAESWGVAQVIFASWPEEITDYHPDSHAGPAFPGA